MRISIVIFLLKALGMSSALADPTHQTEKVLDEDRIAELQRKWNFEVYMTQNLPPTTTQL